MLEVACSEHGIGESSVVSDVLYMVINDACEHVDSADIDADTFTTTF